MKIVGLTARTYQIDLVPPFRAAWDPVPRRTFAETIVTVETDEGARGYGGGAPVPDLDQLSRLLAGLDPTDPAQVFEICQTVDFHGGRNWTVEVAVWDLLARLAGVPLWRYLGGGRDRYPAYASTGERLAPESRAERLQAWKEEGFTAAKIRFHHPDWKEDLKAVVAARDAVGAGMALMVDANQGWRMPGDLTVPWDLARASECAAALSDLAVYWLEEPLPTSDLDGYATLREVGGIRIAAGEMVRSLAESRRLVEVVDVIQNDVVLAGGISGCRKVTAWAEGAGSVWSPHTWSTGLGLLANLHAALAFSTGEYLEVPFDPPGWTPEVRDFMLAAPLQVIDGSLVAPPGPGLGVTPDFPALERWRVG